MSSLTKATPVPAPVNDTMAAPILFPCKIEVASPEGQQPRTVKRSKKDSSSAAPTCTPDAGGSSDDVSMTCLTAAAAPKALSKKRAASKGPEKSNGDGAPATQTLEEGGEGEKIVGENTGALVVAKAVRTLLKNHTTPMHCGSDALPALNSKIQDIIYEAIGRALANGRKTLKNSDF